MSPVSMISISLRALFRNKMRSFLTILGVIIGVGAVVTMTMIGAGAKQQIEAAFEARGANMLIVRPGSSRQGGVRGGAGTRSSLTWEDVDVLRRDLREVRAVAPRLRRGVHINGGGENWGTSVEGTTPDYFALRNWEPQEGSFFTENEVRRGAKVVVLGGTVAEALFPLGDAVGQIVRLGDVPFVVIGIAGRKGANGGGDADDVAFVPVSAFRTRLTRGLGDYLNGRIYIGATAPEAVGRVQTQVETILRTRHDIGPGGEDDFRIQNMDDIREARQEGARVMTSLLAGIALVSLIVGGIGIMNIMLVSVTERTREIGLRMAVGARPRDLMIQFMMEAIALSITGGVLGLGAGLGGAFLLADRFGWNAVLDPNAAILALVSSACVGIFFGLYPAYRASRLDPIQALRYE